MQYNYQFNVQQHCECELATGQSVLHTDQCSAYSTIKTGCSMSLCSVAKDSCRITQPNN